MPSTHHSVPLPAECVQLLASSQQMGNNRITRLTRSSLTSGKPTHRCAEDVRSGACVRGFMGRGGVVWRGTFRLTSSCGSSSGDVAEYSPTPASVRHLLSAQKETFTFNTDVKDKPLDADTASIDLYSCTFRLLETCRDDCDFEEDVVLSLNEL